jgi:pimeloyl-ACP methyl ester carboxylesterase
MLKKTLLLLIFCFSALSPLGAMEEIVKAGQIDICYETFGKKSNPALLLIMGSGSQGILWPEPFCQKLAEAGFFVIRYDNRDTGFSTLFDFEKDPYTLLDMAKDSVALLDALKIEKAHLVGISMGGPIAELIAVHFPQRVHTMTLLATSCDFRPCYIAIENLPREEGLLSGPTADYLAWMRDLKDNVPKTAKEKLEQQLVGWRMISGSVFPFDEALYRGIMKTVQERTCSTTGQFNHYNATKRSLDLIRETPAQVAVPTLVVHGTEDPIFPPDHGEALAKKIKGAKYILIQGMGHVPVSAVFDLLVQKIEELSHF